MRKTFTLLLFAVSLLSVKLVNAQTQAFGKVDQADLELKSCDFEKDANAMVLFDKGDVYFDQDFNIVMERHKRIKIFNDKGKDEANIRIVYYGANRLENITDVQVETINENNGKPEITKLEKKLIYTENIDKARLAIVFAFPNVKPGSIIEYKYRWQTASYAMPDWFFQGRIPVRYSELSTEIPDFFYYKRQTRVNKPFVKNATGSESKSLGSGQDAYSYSTLKQTQGLPNIPSLSDEPFMRSRADNLQCIFFQLTSIKPIGGFVRSFNDTWAKVGGTLADDEDFGGQLKRKLKSEELIIAKAKSLKTDDEKIAYIFNEVKNRMKWNEVDLWYTDDGTAKAWDKQSGNSTEINLALYHLLKQSGLNAYPMVVSTREHGRANPYYPSLHQFNRTVAYIPVDSTRNYVLDASSKYNVYNQIPDELLNSSGLYISKEEKKYDIVFIDNPRAARKIVFLNASILPDGKMDGTAQISCFSYHKLNTMEMYKKDGEEKYKTFLKDNDNNMNISALKLDNMDVDSLPLNQKVDFKLTLTGSDGDYIYFNPNQFLSMHTNPFLSENRASDIDFGHLSSYTINGHYKIPAGFKSEALPKNINLIMPDKSISFRRLVAEEDGTIQVYYLINYQKTIFFKEDYPQLREFYKKMYEMLNEQIVLKKPDTFMLKKTLKYLALCLAPGIIACMAYGQSKDIPAELYKASSIPDSLKKDANSVVRYDSYEETVKGPGKAVIKEHSIVTILNEKAVREAVLLLGYDKFNSVDNAEMMVYDEDGKLIKKYRKSDMYDRSASDGISIITDDRIMVVEHTIAKYPVTIEQITSKSMNSFLDLGQWNIEKEEQSVQNATYLIKINPAIGFRYNNKNTAIKPQKNKVDDLDTYQWEVKNMKACKLEEAAAEWRVLPCIEFAANNFQYNGLPGDISTWDNFGKWLQNLRKDVCTLSPQRVEEIKQMTASLATDKDKARFLYQYLQRNMRYVSVQLGIGGLKPFPATFVDQKKYGDCKALANYMVALLKAVNIPACYAVVRAGANEEPANVSFPGSPFNHIIVCVPFKGDTTWLECTSSTQPFGKLGTLTENRNALLITEDGGKLVNTPRSTIDDNQFNSEVHLVLQPDGGARASMKIMATGEYRNQYLDVAREKTDDQKEYLIRYLNMKQPSVLDLKPGEDKGDMREVAMDLEYDKFCDIMTGDKLFYRPRVFDLWRVTLPVLETRKSDYYFEHPMQKTCITTIDLPQGFEVETMPANASLKFSYGNYDVSYVYDAARNQVVSTTKFRLNRYVIPAAKYTEMQQYMDNIAKVQNKKLVIKRKA